MSSGNLQIPPGVQVTSTNGPTTSTIEFNKPRPTTPLPPLVQADYNSNTGVLEVSAVVFIDVNAQLPSQSITVYYEDCDPAPNFYLSYDSVPASSNEFVAYNVVFSQAMDTCPPYITTVVWDEDPETSRGTETTVKPPTQ